MILMSIPCKPRSVLILLLVLRDYVAEDAEAVQLVRHGEGVDFCFFGVIGDGFAWGHVESAGPGDTYESGAHFRKD